MHEWIFFLFILKCANHERIQFIILQCSVMERQYLKYSTESMDSAFKEVIERVV